MIKPSPESESIISHDFDDLTGRLVPLDEIEKLKLEGPLLFNEEEANATCDLLVHTFRQLCLVEHVTKKYFDEKYKRYAVTVLGKTPQAASNNKSNIIKMLQKGDKISWKKFLELTHLVLGLKPEMISIIFSSVKNKEEIKISTNAEKISSSDEEFKPQPYPMVAFSEAAQPKPKEMEAA